MKKFAALLLALLLAISPLGCSDTVQPGKVLYLNCLPEANEAWQKLAAAYSDAYGVEVTVRTVSAEDCVGAISNALSWDEAPTAFQFHNAQDLQALGGSCLDLTGSAVLSQMITGSFNLTDGGAVKAICFSYDAYGLAVNKALLETAGYSLENITDFESLKAAAEDIHSRRWELGFDAFVAFDAEGSTGTDIARLYDSGRMSPERLRQVLDLYVNNSNQRAPRSAVDISLSQFAAGQAVFCLRSADSYDALLAEPYQMDSDQLAMVPLFHNDTTADPSALCCSPRHYWAVNSRASAADRKATLDFLGWVVSSEYGISVLQELFGGVPFKAASATENRFFGDANALLADGLTPDIPGEIAHDRLPALADSIAEYALSPTEEDWEAILALLYSEQT